MKVLVFTLLCLFIAISEAKVFSRCELAARLKRSGLDGYRGYSLGNWICMAYHESRYNSRAVGQPNSDKSRNYGIFQINSRWWCSNGQGKTANGCQSSCSGQHGWKIAKEKISQSGLMAADSEFDVPK
ncbi:hypothetical protein JD844_010622 [Phrynosoma platyrhinos]|uniref:Lysozyme n=1 Tax=Phrynosoma platyrhinos TaxID=52577 RepID=A0ABQ7THJ3_PHRPL|nr:hypothetical protein JD844_010622 [Phrynosoma platyrhinos]